MKVAFEIPDGSEAADVVAAYARENGLPVAATAGLLFQAALEKRANGLRQPGSVAKRVQERKEAETAQADRRRQEAQARKEAEADRKRKEAEAQARAVPAAGEGKEAAQANRQGQEAEARDPGGADPPAKEAAQPAEAKSGEASGGKPADAKPDQQATEPGRDFGGGQRRRAG